MFYDIQPYYLTGTQESRWSKVFSFVFSGIIGLVFGYLFCTGLEEMRIEHQRQEANKVINVRIVE